MVAILHCEGFLVCYRARGRFRGGRGARGCRCCTALWAGPRFASLVRVPVVTASVRRFSEDGERSHECEACSRHTGTDYANVDLDDGPIRDTPVVPCRVVRVCKGHKRLKAKYANNGHAGPIEYQRTGQGCLKVVVDMCISGRGEEGRWGKSLQYANAEHQADSQFPLPVQAKLRQLTQRNCNHPYIDHDADNRVTPADCVDVQTHAIHLSMPVFPVVADWRALEDRGDDESNTEHPVDDQCGPEGLPGSGRGKDPEVEEED